MRIDVWSDVVCPWCYIGKRRLEKAVANFAHGDDVEVVFHSYQLDPSTPAGTGRRTVEALAQRFGGEEQVRTMFDRVEATAAEDGLIMRLNESVAANTLDAHRLLHLAHDEGRQPEMKEALLAAHFTDSRPVDDHEVLRSVAAQVGLDPARVEAVLDGTEYADAVEADIRQAAAYGATGVPFFVVDAKYGISGAQPVETFEKVLEQAWSEKHPVLQTVPGLGGEAGEVCGTDGCAI